MKLLRPRMRMADIAVARVPAKTADQHYLSTDWKKLRIAVFERDRWRCVVPDCGNAAKVCEHIISRRAGGTDEMSNLCSLCREHDNHFKELPNGQRRNAADWKRIFGALRPPGKKF